MNALTLTYRPYQLQVAGNYAADLLPNMLGKQQGYPIGKLR